VSEEAGIQEASPEATEEQGDASGVNYHDRIRSEPDFAVQQIQEKDRYIGQLNESKARYKPLEQYIDAVGGEKIAELAGIGNRIDTDPRLKQIMTDAINGVTPQPAEVESEEEIFDPEIKALDARYASRYDEQQTVIRELQGRLNETEAVTLKGSLTENMEAALAMFSDDPESLEEAQAEIKRAVDNLTQQAKNGDRSASQQLQQLGTQQGAKTLRMMTIDISDRYYAKKLGESANQPNGEITLSGKATDARTTTRSALPTDTVTIKSGAKVTNALVEDVMARVARKLGKDPDVLFRH